MSVSRGGARRTKQYQKQKRRNIAPLRSIGVVGIQSRVSNDGGHQENENDYQKHDTPGVHSSIRSRVLQPIVVPPWQTKFVAITAGCFDALTWISCAGYK